MSDENQTPIPQPCSTDAIKGHLVPDIKLIIPSSFRIDSVNIFSLQISPKKDDPKEPSKILPLVDMRKVLSSLVHPQEAETKKRRTRLRPGAKTILKNWLMDHSINPYPSSSAVNELIVKTGLTKKQIQTWFVNARIRKVDEIRGNNFKKEGNDDKITTRDHDTSSKQENADK